MKPDYSISNIKNEEWKDLILGLQEKLDLQQFELLDKINLKRDFHVSDWISGKRIPVFDKKFRFIELCKKLNFDYNDLIRFGKHIRRSIRVDNKWISTKKAFTCGEVNKPLLINTDNKKLLNVMALFPSHRNKHPIKFCLKGKKVIIFYDEKRSTRPRPLLLPNFLEFNDDFLVGLGIYLGEGSRNRKPKVTNSEPLIINQAIKFFKLFGIEISKLRVWIQLHERSSKSFDEVKKFWLGKTYLKEENITKIRTKKSSGNASVKQYGTLHLEASFILFQFLIKNLLDSIPSIIKQLPINKIIPFLQGVFAAEGSVELAKTRSLREVRYTSKKEDERELIKNLLEKLNIVVHEYKKGFELRIHGFNNLKKLVEADIFRYHPIRNQKLKQGFDKLKLSKKFIKS